MGTAWHHRSVYNVQCCQLAVLQKACASVAMEKHPANVAETRHWGLVAAYTLQQC